MILFVNVNVIISYCCFVMLMLEFYVGSFDIVLGIVLGFCFVSDFNSIYDLFDLILLDLVHTKNTL